MISPLLALAMSAWMQPTDTTRAAREAFTRCLRTYVERSSQNRMAAGEFTTAYSQQCTAEQTAYRDAVIRRELASRMSRADAEESATTEIDDQRTNFRERFEMNLPQGAAAAPAAPAAPATPAATAPATPPAAAPATAPATASITPPATAPAARPPAATRPPAPAPGASTPPAATTPPANPATAPPTSPPPASQPQPPTR